MVSARMTTVTIITPECVVCGLTSTVTVARDKWHSTWTSGYGHLTMREAFPDMDKDTAELLISGTHPACWDIMWPVEEDEERDATHGGEQTWVSLPRMTDTQD